MDELMDKSAWSCDDDMGYIGYFLSLLHHVHSTNNYANTKVNCLTCKHKKLILNLESQLTSWRYHKSKDPIGVLS